MAQLRCPICGKRFAPGQSAALPFCSEACRRTDLSRWLGEGYGLPVESDDDPPDDFPVED